MSFGRWLPRMALAALPWWAGCEGQNKAPASVTAAAPPPFTITNAQPKLQTMKLWLGTEELIVELALTHNQVATGMMFRKQMAENEGMLFVFARPHRASFYMKNTLLPLSCAYIDSDGTILEIYDMQPLDERPIEAASEKIQCVLETKQSWFERNKIGVGTVVRTELGSLQETFFKR